MNKKDIKKTIETAFNKLYMLDNLGFTAYREKMFLQELKSERQHRKLKPEGITEKPKAPASLAAKYFVAKWVLEALQDNSVKPSDILHCREASLIAKGLVELHRSEIEEALKGFDREMFKEIDYCEHLCG